MTRAPRADFLYPHLVATSPVMMTPMIHPTMGAWVSPVCHGAEITYPEVSPLLS